MSGIEFSAPLPAEPYLLWDSVWDTPAGHTDWALASPAEPGNAGGLRATAAIATAVAISLFSDARVPPDHPLAFLADNDPRGWWGDGVIFADEGAPLGSLLWLLERAPLTINGVPAERYAEQFAQEALAWMVEDRLAASVTVSATADRLASRLDLTVRLFGHDGAVMFDRAFDILWKQVTS